MAGGGAAAAAAAAAKRLRDQEEEYVAMATDDESAPAAFEYKILRSASGAFKNPEKFREALLQESVFGWELAEKFDNERVRLRRPISSRSLDHGKPGDPYRTNYGMTQEAIAVRILIGVGVTVGLALALLAILLAAR